MLTILVVVGGTLVVLVGVVAYNGLARARNQVAEAWSGVDVQLRRRASLVPNLVEVVGGYAQHERQTLEEVTRARGAAQGGAPVGEAGAVQDQLTRALGRLLAVAEQYPQLRASENFRQLQSELSDVEDKIAYARQFYNRTALGYNNRVVTFPSAVIAGAFGLRPAQFFEADEAAHAEVRVHMRSAASGGEPTSAS